MPVVKECICTYCNRKYIYKNGSGHTLEHCNSCNANRRRYSLKQKMVEYKGGNCQRCGYHASMRALQFHHIDGNTKEFNISGNHTYKWDKLQKELDKCILLCANCHAEIHEEQEVRPHVP